MQTEYIAGMPKVELHCHLDGSLPLDAIRGLAGRAGIPVPESDGELTRRVTVPHDCKSLVEYLACFDLAVACLQSEENLYEGVYRLLEAVSRENVAYIEVRFAPLLHLQGGLGPEQVVESAVAGLKAGMRDFDLEAGLILCAMRHRPQEENLPLLDLAERYLGRGVAALDLAGSEADYSVELHSGFFSEAARRGIPFTIHAGEAAGPESVAAAIRLGAKRVGHGTAMASSPELMELCREKDIGVEMCPISNLQTGAAKSWGEYPFGQFIRRGLAVSVNTDNRTVSGTSLTREYGALAEHFPEEMTAVSAKALFEQGVRTAFAADSCKAALRGRWYAFEQTRQAKGWDSHE